MANAMKTYLKHMHNKFNYRATWQPSRPVKIGTYGKIIRGVFSEYGTIKELERKTGISITLTKKDSSDVLEYTSEGSVNITTKLEGKASDASDLLNIEEAGFVVEFSEEDSIVFKVQGVGSEEISNKEQLEKAIIELYNKGQWDKEFVIISEVLSAKSATILISDSSNAKIEIKANGEIGAEKLDIADAALNFQVLQAQGIGVKLIATAGITPLFKLLRLKRKFWGLGEIELKERFIEEEDLKNPLEEFPYSEEELEWD